MITDLTGYVSPAPPSALHYIRLGKGIEDDTGEDDGSPDEGVPRRHFTEEDPDVEDTENGLKGGDQRTL